MCAAVLQAAPLLAIPSFLRLEQFLLSKQEEGYRALLQQVGQANLMFSLD
jgi:hypothetical protein